MTRRSSDPFRIISGRQPSDAEPGAGFEVNPKVRQIFELSDLKGLVFVLSRCQALQL